MTTNLLQAFDAQLASYHALTTRALIDALPSREPRRYLYDLVTTQLARGGKGLRPALCIASCRAFGGSVEKVMESAAAIELLHNAFIVHDDVEDGSEFRRDQPTLLAEHGVGIAVNVGDALNALTMRPLSRNLDVLGPDLAARVYREFEHLLVESIEGQAIELGWIRDNVCDLTADDYLRMTLKKTAWYTCMHPCRIGAVIATEGRVDPARFNRFGYFLGVAFQIQDDLLNLLGQRSRYGKEILGDLWEGKRTLMLVHLLQQCTEDERQRIGAFLGTERSAKTEEDVQWLNSLMLTYGSLDYARTAAVALADAAAQELPRAYAEAPPSDDLKFIEALVRYVVERDL